MEELAFLDLVVLQRIEPGTVVEKFGIKINSSFFDAANILGTLKQKSYIDFKSTYPGPSEVEVTQVGARMLEVADEKAKEAVDELDFAILKKIVDGYRDPDEIKSELNIRSGDLALRLHKLVKQDLVSYVVKNIKISLSITEDGFKKISAMPKKEKPPEEMVGGEAPVAEPAAPAAPVAEAAPAGPVTLDSATKRKAKMEYYMEKLKKNQKKIAAYIAIVVLLVIVIAAYLLFLRK